MGKASSSKKVARAAKAGGSASADQRKLGFPAAIIAILVLGTGLVLLARSEYTSANSEESLDWQNAYGVYTCDTFVPPFTDTVTEVDGMTLLPDGLVEIRRRDRVLGNFAEMVGMEVSDGTLVLPDGTTFANGDDCGGEPGRVVVARWPADAPDADPTIFESSLSTVSFVEDDGIFAVAFLPESKDVPRPPSVPALGGDGGSDAGSEGGDTTTTAVPEETTTTTATGDTTAPEGGAEGDPADGDTTDPTDTTVSEGGSEGETTTTSAP